MSAMGPSPQQLEALMAQQGPPQMGEPGEPQQDPSQKAQEPPQMEQGEVDPNSPPGDPMLSDPYGTQGQNPETVEVEEIEKVELCVLGAIESAAKGVEIGAGAADPEFVSKYAMAVQALCLGYQALAGAEKTIEAPAAPQMQSGFTDPSTHQA